MTVMLKQARKDLGAYFRKKGRGAAAALARECGVGESLPWRWVRGDRTPTADDDTRVTIERVTGIPALWWRREKRKRTAEASP